MSESKTCVRCRNSKSIGEFSVDRSKDDGLNIYCRECIKEKKAHRLAKLNANRPANWKRKTVDIKAYRSEWLKSHPGYNTKKCREWKKAHPERERINEQVRYAVKTGRLVKTPCEVCGETNVQAHHPDYSKPLDVIWLCRGHHVELHRQIRRRD